MTLVEASVAPGRRRGQHGQHKIRKSAGPLALALAGYLALSIVLWWHVWTSHPNSVAVCGCNDPSLFEWFLAWAAYALAHGHNPFYSTAVFYPGGINLLSNTGVLALGIPLAPVTWLFGPITTLNVASTLGPALSALSTFWLLRRWVQWAPAAFVGGLIFGFAPFALDNLAVSHLNTEWLVLVPLMVGCLDELLVRQRRRPAIVGLALGLLVVVQFFLSTEMLVIVGLCAAVGIVVLVMAAGIRRFSTVTDRVAHAGRGLAVAAGVIVVLLAYPVWFALRGPAHLSGLVWPTIAPGTGGIDLSDLWHLRFMSQQSLRLFSGYEGAAALPKGEYLGAGLLIPVLVGLILWRRDRRLWFFSAVGVITVFLSLDVHHSFWVPWRVLAHIPLIQNVVPSRVFATTTFCAAVAVGLVIDHSRDSVAAGIRRLAPPPARSDRPHVAGAIRVASTAFVAAVIAMAVGAVAIVPMATAMDGNVPFAVQPVQVPRWFTVVAPHLPHGQVVLAYPPPVIGASAMTWQAIDALHFIQATGAGPASIPARAGIERAGLYVLTKDALVLSPPVPGTAKNIDALREALAGWGVTVVVVPDPSILLPRFNRTSSTAAALGIFTAAIGRLPQYRDDAWVWTDVATPGPTLSLSTSAFGRCIAEPLVRQGSPIVVPDCVVAASAVP